MSRQLPRSVYVRRRLLLLAAVFLVAWLGVQAWGAITGDKPSPTVTSTVTALPSLSPSPSPIPTTPVPTTPATESTTNIALAKATKACDSTKLTMTPSVPSPQFTRRPVLVDISLMTSSKKPCIFTPKSYDPLAVISQNDTAVWDSSVCKKAVVSRPIQVSPGWTTTVRVPWIPRGSGTKCKSDEDWVSPGSYELRIGTLGGEPGKSKFTLNPAPKPPPKPKPTATVKPSAKPTVKPSVKPSAKPAG